MKRVLFIAFTIFLCSFISAEIIINEQPKELYNLGDVITIPVTVAYLKEVSGTLLMDLICEGKTVNFYKNGISLAAGEEKRLESSLVLEKAMIGELKGSCKIKTKLGADFILTNSFRISNYISVVKTSEQAEFNPGDYLIVKGNAVKDNGEGADGFVEVKVISGNSSLVEYMETVKAGSFSLNVSLPKDLKAGAYPVKLRVYEKDADELETNSGFLDFNIIIRQVPTSLEIVFENQEVEPGTNLKVQTILHDQTGEKIASSSFITVKDASDKIMEQVEKNTEEFLEFPIPYNQPPSQWKVVAASSKIMSESSFKIKTREKIKIEIINKTILITNIGNVPYNKTVVIKIDKKSLPVDVYLNVDENKKYLMSAPQGDYEIEVSTQEGDKITGMSLLTGKAVDIKEYSSSIIGYIKKPFIWGFIIVILGLAAFLIFNKVRKKKFFGFIRKAKKNKKNPVELTKDSSISSRGSNKAELSLSIKGDKQDVSLICLKIKNLKELSGKNDVKETLGKINTLTEDNKAVLYESQDFLFYVFAPIKTKTFQNESNALKTAGEVRDILANHNRLFKHKMDFGISLNYGTIIAKQEDTLKIMSLGTLMLSSKKIASLSRGEVLVSENMNQKIARFAKTQKETRENTNVYSLRGIKDTEEHREFINKFMKRLDKGE